MKFLLTLLSRLYKERLIHYQFFMVLVYIFKYRLLRPLTMGPIAKYRPPSWRSGEPPKSLKETKIALICDDMTWKNFDGICKIVFLTPQNWREELEHFQPDLLFCESTWSGNEDHKGCWDYAVFHARKLPFDNRRALKRILRYCRAAALPTVFWNKEDPPMFRDQAIISFRDTAYLFDYVFTTAEECIEEYKTHGCQNVKTLMFGYSPKLFFPVPMEADCRVAAFFGSWYQSQPQRCQALTAMFDEVLSRGLELVIYDRFSGSGREDMLFPEPYRCYVRPAIPYSSIRDALRRVRYVINANTVTDSNTMFARRVFEITACGRILLSNASPGLTRIFKEGMWFIGKEFDFKREKEYINQNYKIVKKHTWETRVREVLHTVFPNNYI